MGLNAEGVNGNAALFQVGQQLDDVGSTSIAV